MKTVLIVNDNVEMIDALEFCIKELGYNTICSTSGESAMYNLLTNQVDLVLCDIKMPSGSGEDLMQALYENRMRYPIIFFTGYEDKRVISDLKHLGAIDVLMKPVDLDELETMVRGVLSGVFNAA